MTVVRSTFKPEFLNRLDEVVVFDALSRDDLAHIVELQVRAFAARLSDRRITLTVTDDAREWLADRGYDPAYGARPLRRLVQREIGDRLARALLAGEVRDGSDRHGGRRRRPARRSSCPERRRRQVLECAV